MKKPILLLFAGALVLGGTTAHADVISDWNIQAAQRIAASAPPRRGPSAVLDFAVVHLAMHDAVQAFERRYQPYCAAIPNAAADAANNHMPISKHEDARTPSPKAAASHSIGSVLKLRGHRSWDIDMDLTRSLCTVRSRRTFFR